MSRNTLRGRGRAAASVVASMALFGGAAAVTTGPAQSAEPAGDCTEAFPVSELTDDQAVTALSVVKGTTPVEFEGTVIGVVDDLIAPDLDMVMVEITPPEPDEIGGIWQGMSGSPVYAADGRLIGAIAYGLSWGPSWVAGVTPFEDMQGQLPPAGGARVRVSDRNARRIAAESDVTARQASEGFTRLKVPMGVTGVSAERVAQSRRAQKERKARYLGRANTTAGTTDSPLAPDASTIVAGGNLAVTLSYGDVTMGGVGTATSVCNGGLVGFGHPAFFSGDTTLSMHAADAVYVQGESLGAPFKVANIALSPVGTIDGDYLTGVSGFFGATPDTARVTSTVSYRERTRTGSSDVSLPEANAAVTFYQQLINHDRVLESIGAGSELMTWTVSGNDNGTPFALGMTDRYASSYDIAFASPWDVADAVWYLSRLEGVTVEDVVVDGAVDDDSSTWRVDTVEQRRDGDWVEVTRRQAAVVKAGRTLRLRVLLTGTAGERVVPLGIPVPARAAGLRGGLSVSGGAWTWNGGSVDSVEDLEKQIARTVRNDAVQAQLGIEGRRGQIRRTVVSDPTDKVVHGEKWVRVKVR